MAAEEMGASPRWQLLGIEWSPDVNLYAVSFRWVVALTATLPVLKVISFTLTSRRVQHGACINCGYDLRATPDRCPECGTSV